MRTPLSIWFFLVVTVAMSAAGFTNCPYVIVVSVDGMGSAYVRPLLEAGLTNELTAFKRLQAEGAGTLNARDDAQYAITLPNHVTMMTGRGVAGAAGHNWTGNGDPAPTDTIASNKGSYVASGFDVAHDRGLRTGIWSGKSKFNLFQQSYGPATGAADATGPDNGRDKIDYDKVTASISAAALAADFTNRMTLDPFHFSFVHFQDPDATGHASGWSTNPASAFAATLKRVDNQVSNILRMAETVPALAGKTAVILTADHGGHGTTHGDTTNPLDYTIPFYVWGPNVRPGGDLYAMNPGSRTQPGATQNPGYAGGQPVRNGDAANLALDLLGLPAVPGSTIGAGQDLRAVGELLAITSISASAGAWILGGQAGAAGTVVTEKGTSPAAASAWSPVATNAVAAGPFTVTVPAGSGGSAFFRLILR